MENNLDIDLSVNLRCPKCNNNLIPIMYGRVSSDYANSMTDKVFWGGCFVSKNDPKYYCSKCKLKYYNDLKQCDDSNSTN